MTTRDVGTAARTAWGWIVPIAVVVLLAFALRGAFLVVAPVAAGIVAIWVALSRRMPALPRVALIAAGAALIALPLLVALDVAYGFALVKVTG